MSKINNYRKWITERIRAGEVTEADSINIAKKLDAALKALDDIENSYRAKGAWEVPMIGDGLIHTSNQVVASGTPFWRDKIVNEHNEQIVALTHCADILQEELVGLNRRVTDFCESISTEDGDIYVGETYIGWSDVASEIVEGIKCHLLAAIEGRNNG